MSSSGIISSNNQKIFDNLLPNPYPYPAQPPTLAQVLATNPNGDDAGNQNISNLLQLETTNVVQQDQIGGHLTIGGTPSNPGSGGDLRIQGATLKGSILAGDGTSTVGLPVGANGLVLKANSATATGLEWGTDASGGTVMAVNAGVNIDISGTIAQPIVNLQNPLTAQLNIGSQTLVGSTNVGTETTTLDINSGSVAPATGLVEMDFNDTNPVKPIGGFNNIRISNTEAGAVMSWGVNDTVAGQITQVVKQDLTQDNQHQLNILITDVNSTTNSSVSRIDTTRGDQTGCVDVIISTDNTNIRSATRQEKTDFALGIVDTSTYALTTPLANAQRIQTINSSSVQDDYTFTDGLTNTDVLIAVNANSSQTTNALTSGSILSSSQVFVSTTKAEHELRRATATQNTRITNDAELNLGRLQGSLTDTGVANLTQIDTTNSNCVIAQQVFVGGITKNTSLTTTNALTTLTTDANFNIASTGAIGLTTTGGAIGLTATGGLNINAGIIGSNTAPVVIANSGIGGQANPLLTLTNSNATGSVALEVYKNKPTASVGGDVLFNQSVYGKDGANNKQEYTRITHSVRDNTSGSEDGSMELSCFNAGSISTFLQLNGIENEVNCLKNLDMTGKNIITNTGDMLINTATSIGTGNLSVQAKGFGQFGGETGFTNLYNTNGNINITAGGVASDLILTCPNWESTTSTGVSGKYLRIKLNGVYYKIVLEND